MRLDDLPVDFHLPACRVSGPLLQRRPAIRFCPGQRPSRPPGRTWNWACSITSTSRSSPTAARETGPAKDISIPASTIPPSSTPISGSKRPRHGGRLYGLRGQALHRLHLLAERRLSLRRAAIEVAGRQRGRGGRLRGFVPEVRHQARHLLQHAGQRLLRGLRQLHGERHQRSQRSAADRVSAAGRTAGDRALGQLRAAHLHLVRRRHAPAGQRRAGPGADPQAAPAARRDVPGAARQSGRQHPLARQRTGRNGLSVLEHGGPGQRLRGRQSRGQSLAAGRVRCPLAEPCLVLASQPARARSAASRNWSRCTTARWAAAAT